MWLRSALKFWRSGPQRQRRSRPAPNRQASYRPNLETLEYRCVPSTLNVTSNADNGAAGTLRWAVAQAKAGDTIDIMTTKPIALTQGELYLNRSVTIESPVGAAATISGNGISRVFELAAGSVNLDNLIITGGNAVADNPSGNSSMNGYGGAIFNHASLTLNQCTLSGNSAGFGGGAIYNSGGGVTVNDSILSGNSATYGGAIESVSIFGRSASLTLSASTVSGNSATDGGGIYTRGFSRGNIVNSYKWRSFVTISDSTLSGNSATYGGGIYSGPLSTVHIGRSTFFENTPDNIFGAYIDDGGNTGL